MNASSEFVYRLPGQSKGHRPGAHRSHARGPGLSFSHHVPLMDMPDPRRLDLRASLRNVRGDWLVKASRQHSTSVIQVLMDVSASMHFGAPERKLQVAADFMESLGRSAFSIGDALGFQAFDLVPIPDLYQPARTSRSIGLHLADRLRQLPGGKARGELQSSTFPAMASQLRRGSALVFLVSDLHWPLSRLDEAFDALRGFTVVPIVLWSPAETHPPSGGRWLRARDMEGGGSRTLLMRQSTMRRWRQNVEQRRQAIRRHCERHDITPFFMDGGFQAEALTRHFMETVP